MDEYRFGYSLAELERLKQQDRIWQVSTHEHLRAGNIRRGYSIGYVPTAAQHVHNQTHRVKVLVRAPGRNDLSVRVRREYMESE